MDLKSTFNVYCALAVCLAVSVAAGEEEKMPGVEVTEQVVDQNGELTNDTITWCNADAKGKCECSKDLPSEAPGSSKPENACVKINVAMGHARYSALTKSIMLQLNELVPNSALYSPSGFKVVAGFAVNSVSRVKNTSGVPKYVTLTSSAGVPVTFEFADGESVGTPLMTTENLADGRLAMADAQGWATATDPAYYDYYPGGGARWRFGAAVLSPDYMQFVEHRTPEGRVETRQDLGLEIVRDAEGCLRQVATPAWVADFLVTGQDSYDLKIYPNDASCVAGARTSEGYFGFAQGAEPAVVWEFRNPQPGVMRDLQVTKKLGTVSETWLYKYVEDVQDFTLVYPQNAKQIRLEKYDSDSGKSRVVRRNVLGGDGKVFSVEEKHFDILSGRSRLAMSVRDPGGLNLTRAYSYYPEGPLEGLPSVDVGEDGAWARYEYDDQRRTTAEIRPWLDAPTNAPVNQCAVTRYGYDFVDTADFLRGGDKRPRTVVNEICGIEVSRTYHAYPTNAQGQSQEIVEHAAFQGSPYGHASNRRTVKTYYAPSAAVPLAGRLASIAYPGIKVENFGYEYGAFNAATYLFTPDPDGGAWRETVTTFYGANSGVQTLRFARVWDEKGREVLNESNVEDGAAFAVIGWKRMSYDLKGMLVETAHSDGRIESATWGSNCCGKESETSAEGIITVYGYNELKQRVSETKKGFAVDGADDIVTLYTYDINGRVLSTAVTNIASRLGFVGSRNIYDTVGRLTNAFDRLGNVTVYSYPGGTVNRQIVPSGVTNVTERYLGGQTKHVLENGVVKQSYAYGINADGTQWTLSADGPLPAALQSSVELPSFSDLEMLDFPWNLLVHNVLGQTVASLKPGFCGTTLITSNSYDNADQLVAATQYSIDSANPVSVVTISKKLNSYSPDGSLVLTSLDVNTNGVVDLAGPDRVAGSLTAYEKDAVDSWWSVSRSWFYPKFDSVVAVTTSVRRVLLTGLGVQRGDRGLLYSHREILDKRNSVTTVSSFVDRTARKVTNVTTLSTSSQPEIKTTVNGLQVRAVSSSAVTNTFGYDGVGQQITNTDGRGNTTLTTYNALGHVASTEDATTNRTSYTYDTLGHRIEILDSCGNVTHTAYDIEGRVTRVWGTTTYPVEYGYDDKSRIVSIKTFRDQNEIGDETRWLRDNPTGLLTNKLYCDGRGPAYTYTADGKLETRLWARGVLTSYAYDRVGALVAVDYSDSTPDVNFTFDRLGNLLSATSPVSTNLFFYSPQSFDVVSESQNGTIVTRSVDTFGRSLSFGLEDYDIKYNYNEFGLLSSISSLVSSAACEINYAFSPGSSLLTGYKVDSPSTNLRFDFVKSYEPHRDVICQVRNATDVGVIFQYDYTNDVLGRRVNRNDSGLAFAESQFSTFGYNQRSEVTSVLTGTNAYCYAYDSIGNRLHSASEALTNYYAVNMLNQYTNLESSAFSRQMSYDPDGNMVTNGVWSYLWDGENRMVLACSNGSSVVRNVYDHQSRRISIITAAEERVLIWDGWNTVCEHVTGIDGVRTNFFVWGLDLSSSFHGAGGAGGLLVEVKDGVPYYASYDANGNISGYVNQDGTSCCHFEYDAFGDCATVVSDAADDFSFRFSSKYFDVETGLYYYGFRFYEPTMGRWINRDSINESGGFNLYSCLANDLLNHVDRLGMIRVVGGVKIGDESYSDTDGSECCDVGTLMGNIEASGLRPLISKLGATPSKTGGVPCLSKISCGKCNTDVYHDGQRCPECSGSAAGQYEMTRSGGEITMCGYPSPGRLRHELQHAQQCKNTLCDKESADDSACLEFFRAELEAYVCGTDGFSDWDNPCRNIESDYAKRVCVNRLIDAFLSTDGSPHQRLHNKCRKTCRNYIDNGGQPTSALALALINMFPTIRCAGK